MVIAYRSSSTASCISFSTINLIYIFLKQSVFAILLSVFQMLTNKWHGLFSLAVTTLCLILITQITPVIAGTGFPFPIQLRDRAVLETTIVADNAIATVKQQHSVLFQQLNLSSSQKQKIEQIHNRYKQQIRKKKHNLSLLQKQLSDLMVGTESVESIRAKNQQLVNLRHEIGELRFESMLATREILTPQQRLKFREIIESQITE